MTAFDILLQFIYKQNEPDSRDEMFFTLNMVFYCFFIVIYVVLFFSLSPALSIIWGAVIFTAIYFGEYLLAWIIMPRVFSEAYDE